MASEMLDKLKSYLESTSVEQLRSEWKEIESLGFRGPNAYEYMEFIAEAYCNYINPPLEDYINLEKMTSNFSGSFFFIKLVP